MNTTKPLETELDIERLGGRGDGVGKVGDEKVYVPFTVPGDHVRARVGGRRGEGFSAELIDVIEAGPDRAEPPCLYFGRCGGCAMQHVTPVAELEWKRRLVSDALGRRGLDEVPVSDTVTVPADSRRRTTFTVINAGGRILLGYLARGSHRVIPIQSCSVLDPDLECLILPLTALAHNLPIPRKGLQVSLTKTGSGLDIVVGGRKDLTLELRERLTEFSRQHDLARLSWGAKHPEPVIMQRTPTVEFGGITVEPPMTGFLQASVAAEKALSDQVVDHLNDCKHVVDLFAGIGTFALALAGEGRGIRAYDGDEEAISALRRAVNNSAGRVNIDIEVRDLEQRALSADEFTKVEGVVLDPPRAGAKRQCRALAQSGVRKIAYVSCAPGTFARDARSLVDGGYTLKSVVPINQFPWSSHVELVGCFEK
ncbi:MAG: 23S rRNA (uracil(1939)-C(5))-methyltransferase RlmD [Alphaproteobacteria bacterium]|nr:23S rRNA (uracil(1939)-C(5))-methyltransferase RlmD [Alphaproteobacteria bacterium]